MNPWMNNYTPLFYMDVIIHAIDLILVREFLLVMWPQVSLLVFERFGGSFLLRKPIHIATLFLLVTKMLGIIMPRSFSKSIPAGKTVPLLWIKTVSRKTKLNYSVFYHFRWNIFLIPPTLVTECTNKVGVYNTCSYPGISWHPKSRYWWYN